MKIFDSHAHYDDERYDENRQALLDELFAGDVKKIVNVGASISSSKKAVEMSKIYPGMYSAVGIHPESVLEDTKDENWLSLLEQMYLENPKTVAIGEIGLDYYWTRDTRPLQIECFKKQLDLAKKLSAPVIIHDRDAHGDCMEILREQSGICAVMHAFSGSPEMARELIKMGHYISFGGVVTFKNARKTVEVVESLCDLGSFALDRVLVETDAPYLTPTPHRGETNRSDYIKFVSEKCGELLKIDPEEFCEKTYNNAMRFFGISE